MPTAARTTEYRYNGDGRLVEVRAHNADTSASGEQVTTWEYGTTLAESEVASFDLVKAKVYPDDVSGSGRVEYRYNRLGELTGMTDQNQTAHQYDYDLLGRFIHDRVTLPTGSAIDWAVLRLSRTYNAHGLLEAVTSHDNATVGSGTVKDEVKMEYNGFGQVAREYQAHAGAVNTATTPKVSYGYADGTNNTARRTSMTYPDGRVIGYSYGTSGSIDDLTDRIATILDRGSNLVTCTRRGVKSTVRIQYLEPGVELTYIQQSGQPVGDGGDRYTGLDRFNRIQDIRWLKTSTGSDVDRYQYGFDQAGNRTWRRNVTAPNTLDPNGGWDEAYSYEGFYQLSQLARGDLNLNRTGIAGIPKWQENWAYDETGNWNTYQTAVNGLPAINNREPIVGYDGAGNLTTMPKVGDWNTAQNLKWDAWNRLMKITEGPSTVGEYRYDGFTRRITKQSSEAGLSTLRHAYYYIEWQALEERVGTQAAPERQFVWGLRYIDDLVLRDRNRSSSSSSSHSSGASPALTERLYATQDQWHVTGLLSTTGAVLERYAYKAFGEVAVLTGAYVSRTNSSFAWAFAFGGYYWDDESKMYTVRYRHLHFGLGRWLVLDRLEAVDDRNLYSYTRNGPTNYTDWLGLQRNVCACDAGEVNRKGHEYARLAAKRSEADKQSIPKHAEPGSSPREFGGRICCNLKTKIVTATGPVPGPWKSEGPRLWLGDTFDILLAPDCPEDAIQVGQYHSHPDATPGPSRGDIFTLLGIHGGWPHFISATGTNVVTRTDPSGRHMRKSGYGEGMDQGGIVVTINPDGTESTPLGIIYRTK